jgi:hypothetical protein
VVLVTMKYKIADMDKFLAARAWGREHIDASYNPPASDPPPRFFRSTTDPTEFIFLEEWSSAEMMRDAWERYVRERRSGFLERAGLTEDDVERTEWELHDSRA